MISATTDTIAKAITAAQQYMRRSGGFDAQRLGLVLIRNGFPERSAMKAASDLIYSAAAVGHVEHVKGFRWRWASDHS